MPITFNETPETVEDTQNEVASGRSRERDETQLSLDNIVKAMVAEWTSKGKPTPENGAPRKRFTVPTKDRSAFKNMIRRATTLHKVTPMWYKDVKSGDNTTVKFAIVPQPAKATPDATAAATPAAPAAPVPAAPAAPQPPAESQPRRGLVGRR